MRIFPKRKKKPPTPGSKNGDGQNGGRLGIAYTVIWLSFIAILVAGGLALGFAGHKRGEVARLVFTSVLALVGTWVGAVIAFYFSRDNLRAGAESVQSATETALRFAGRPAPNTPVQEVMIPAEKILAHRLGTGEDARQVALHVLFEKMQDSGLHRIAVLNDSSTVLYVVHDSSISAIASKDPVGSPPDAVGNPADANFAKTLGDLLDDTELGPLQTAIGFVGPTAVLSEARATMRSIPGCNDVFVTTDGKATGRMLGWLTNTDLAGVAE